jgi:tetratricopeptide (TPR) repeat protein
MNAHISRHRPGWLLASAAAALLTCTGATAAVDKSILKSQEATAALLRGRFDQAVLAFDDALKDTDLPVARQAGLYSDRGVAKWRLKQLDGALADFTKAVSLNPDYAPAYNNRGNVYMEVNRVEDAYKDFDKAITLSPNFGAAYSNRGIANERLNKLSAAESDFRRAVEMMPANAVPHNGRGKVESALGRNYTALRYLNRAITLNGQYAPAYQNRALVLMLLDRNEDAIQDLDKVIALSPENADLYVYRGQAYARDKRGPQAFRDFSKAVDLAPDNPAALIGRAAQNLDRKRADLSIADMDKAITIDANRAEAYFWRGQARYSTGDLDGAEKDLSKAIELDPAYSSAYRVRGGFRERAGQQDEAIADYRKALELDPFSRDARDAYAAASGETPDNVIKPIAPAVDGWEVYRSRSGSYTAVNERYPKILVPLEMQGEGDAVILEWTPLKDSLSGIGLLRYRAGETKGSAFEDVAIIDLYRNQVVGIEPYVSGDTKSKWAWAPNAVTVTDQEGLTSYYELRKPRVEAQARNNDNPFSIFSQRSNPRSRHGGQGIFGWLFQ